MTYDYTVVAIGLVAGLVARFVVPGRRPLNVLLAMILGAGGAYGAVYAARYYKFIRPA
jgi:uncharacterized membrane protein YeaQ/YmgE (transglycosylase-associated protein family)